MDHINNKHNNLEDYRLENLQLLTPGENIVKDQKVFAKPIKCKLDRPLSYYENKLSDYRYAYEQAKLVHDAKLTHKLRSNISQTKARIAYWKQHHEGE